MNKNSVRAVRSLERKTISELYYVLRFHFLAGKPAEDSELMLGISGGDADFEGDIAPSVVSEMRIIQD